MAIELILEKPFFLDGLMKAGSIAAWNRRICFFENSMLVFDGTWVFGLETKPEQDFTFDGKPHNFPVFEHPEHDGFQHNDVYNPDHDSDPGRLVEFVFRYSQPGCYFSLPFEKYLPNDCFSFNLLPFHQETVL